MTTVDELLAAIGPNVTVELAAGEYDLAGAASYGKDTGNRFCRWEATLEQGYELHISGVDGLTIKAAKSKKVDAVTGATFTSEALIENVKQGLDYYEKNK